MGGFLVLFAFMFAMAGLAVSGGLQSGRSARLAIHHSLSRLNEFCGLLLPASSLPCGRGLGWQRLHIRQQFCRIGGCAFACGDFFMQAGITFESFFHDRADVRSTDISGIETGGNEDEQENTGLHNWELDEFWKAKRIKASANVAF
jgi:hypothetical protein